MNDDSYLPEGNYWHRDVGHAYGDPNVPVHNRYDSRNAVPGYDPKNPPYWHKNGDTYGNAPVPRRNINDPPPFKSGKLPPYWHGGAGHAYGGYTGYRDYEKDPGPYLNLNTPPYNPAPGSRADIKERKKEKEAEQRRAESSRQPHAPVHSKDSKAKEKHVANSHPNSGGKIPPPPPVHQANPKQVDHHQITRNSDEVRRGRSPGPRPLAGDPNSNLKSLAPKLSPSQPANQPSPKPLAKVTKSPQVQIPAPAKVKQGARHRSV